MAAEQGRNEFDWTRFDDINLLFVCLFENKPVNKLGSDHIMIRIGTKIILCSFREYSPEQTDAA